MFWNLERGNSEAGAFDILSPTYIFEDIQINGRMSSSSFLPGKNLPEKEGIEDRVLQNIFTMLICTISPSYTIKSRWATNCQNTLSPETTHIHNFVSGNLPAEKKKNNAERAAQA